MGLQEALLPRFPGLLRFYRTRLTLDLGAILSYLPEKGRLLDVGCGAGNVSWEVAKRRPDVSILGIDLDPELIRLAETFHARPNLKYACLPLEQAPGHYDCVSFVDVLHHVPHREKPALLAAARERLTPDGAVFIKDVSAGSEDPAYWMDRWLSGCRELWFLDPEAWAPFLPPGLSVQVIQRGYRIPFSHYYLLLSRTP
jgi:2-polyprenyl-3-methyl-5-hydroxy-6-metoxy-1,4-benzoquinol methylase